MDVRVYRGIRMKNIKIIDILKALIVIMFFNMTLLGQSSLKKSNWPQVTRDYELLTIILAAFLLITTMGIIKITKESVTDVLLIVGPYIFAFFVSGLEILLYHNISFGWMVSQLLYPLLAFACAFCTVKVFGEKAIDLITYGAIANYTIYVVVYLSTYGLFGITNFFAISEGFTYFNYLEVHEATFAMGLLLIYYCLKSFKYNKVKILWLALYVFLGYKRILFPAIGIAIVLGLIIMYKKKRSIVLLFSTITFLIVAGWLFFVTSDYYELVATLLNVELNSRTFSGNGLYGRLDGYYNMKPSYIGSGIGFVQNVMNIYATNTGSKVNGFHNDILKYYIDLGFIPFFIFMILLIYVVPYIIAAKRSYFKVATYVACVLMTLTCWTTDNLATYPNFLYVSFVIICCCVFANTENKNEGAK